VFDPGLCRPRHADLLQRHVLLGGVHVGLADAALGTRAGQGDLHGVDEVEEAEGDDVLGRHVIKLGHQLPGDHAALLHRLEILPGLEHDIERDLEGTGVLAADHLGDVAQRGRLGGHGQISS